MTLYLVSFAGRLERHAEAARAELRKWGATRLWDDVWVAEMDTAPEKCLPGLVQTEAAIALPIGAADGIFFAIGRAAGMAAQLTYTQQVEPLLRPADWADVPLADIAYCNGGEAVFARAVDHYLVTRRKLVWATELCRVMAGHGSDKGLGWHTYTPFYQALFLDRRETVTALFELGLGTNNEDTPSNMGAHGSPGASLRGWRDHFPNARIYGADVDRRVLFEEDRIETFFVDQRDPDSFDRLWALLPGIAFDVFIDDGLHTPDAARLTFDRSIGRLRPGGLYVVEDVARGDVPAYLDMVAARGLAGMSIDIAHPSNIYDNCLVVAAA